MKLQLKTRFCSKWPNFGFAMENYETSINAEGNPTMLYLLDFKLQANLGAMDDLDHEGIEENLDHKDHRENEVYPV